MRLSDYFAAAGRWPHKAAMLFWLNALYCSAITFIPEYAPTSDVAKVFFTILACFPIIISIWAVWVAFVWPLYNNIMDDEKHLNPFSYVYIWLSKAVSVSMIYLIFWVWHKDSFEFFPIGIGAFHAWGWTLAVAFTSTAGTAAFSSGDQSNVFLALIVNFDVIMSMMSNVMFFGIVVAVRRAVLETPPSKHIEMKQTNLLPFSTAQQRIPYSNSSESDSD